MEKMIKFADTMGLDESYQVSYALLIQQASSDRSEQYKYLLDIESVLNHSRGTLF